MEVSLRVRCASTENWTARLRRRRGRLSAVLRGLGCHWRVASAELAGSCSPPSPNTIPRGRSSSSPSLSVKSSRKLPGPVLDVRRRIETRRTVSGGIRARTGLYCTSETPVPRCRIASTGKMPVAPFNSGLTKPSEPTSWGCPIDYQARNTTTNQKTAVINKCQTMVFKSSLIFAVGEPSRVCFLTARNTFSNPCR